MAEPCSPVVPVKLALKCRNLEALVHETFSSISTLRGAFHIQMKMGSENQLVSDALSSSPLAAVATPPDKVILRELKKLSELKYKYQWQCGGSREGSHERIPSLCPDDEWSPAWNHDMGQHERESLAGLKLQLQMKEAEIQNLNSTVERLLAKKEKLERRVRKLMERKGQVDTGTMNVRSWDHVVEEKEKVAASVQATGNTAATTAIANGLSGKSPDGHGVFMDFTSKLQVPHIGTKQSVSKVTSCTPLKQRNGVLEKSATLNSTPKTHNNAVSEKQRRRGSLEVPMDMSGTGQVKRLLEGAVAEVKETTTEFGKAMAGYMRRAKWDVDEAGVDWVDQSHKLLAVHAYICTGMFKGFEHEDFYMSGRLSWLLEPARHREECRQQYEAMAQMVEEPLDLLSGLAPDSAFGQFCRKKYLQIFTAPMEEALLGDLQHRRCLVQDGAHPHWSRFYQMFVRMAKAVWMVHKLAFSLEPRVSIFQAEKGSDFSSASMVSHIPKLELASDTHNLLPKVAFTIMPGFCTVDHILIRCRVYLNGMKASSSASSSG